VGLLNCPCLAVRYSAAAIRSAAKNATVNVVRRDLVRDSMPGIACDVWQFGDLDSGSGHDLN
jgi:hypothetical protein